MPESVRFRIVWASTLLALIPLSPCRSSPVVRVGLYENGPKIFTDENGRPSGFFVDVVTEIAKREKWELRFVNGTWDECLAGVAKGSIDIMPDVAWSEERARIYDFSWESALSTWSQVYSRKGVLVGSILDLDRKRIAVLTASIQQQTLAKLARQCNVTFEIVGCPSFDEVFRAVQAGRADVAVVNRFFGATHRDRYGLEETTVLIDPASLHFVTRKGRYQEHLAALDRSLWALKEDRGSPYYRSMDRWFNSGGPFRMPPWLGWLLGAGAAALAVAVAFSGVLKWQLGLRSAELAAKNVRLEATLGELEKAQAEGLRRERLRTLERTARGIARDLSRVLAPIMGHTSLLLSGEGALRDESRVRKALADIGDSARDGARILEKMRSFSGDREGRKPISLQVSAILDGIYAEISSLKPARSGRIAIERQGDSGAAVLVEPAEMAEALLAVLRNAAEAMPDGGTIRISTSASRGRVTVTIDDEGPGMDAETIRNCLRPFFTTKGPGSAGMGLPTARSIVEMHGGTLEITGTPGAGTRVTISLPESPSRPG